MDGTEPEVLVPDLDKPAFLTIDLQKEELFFSSSGVQDAKVRVSSFSPSWLCFQSVL